MATNENEVTIEQLSMDIIPPHPTNFLRAVNLTMIRNLKEDTNVSFALPTLMERAKSFVNKDRFIAIFYVKD